MDDPLPPIVGVGILFSTRAGFNVRGQAELRNKKMGSGIAGDLES
jgi:hypothetical protein